MILKKAYDLYFLNRPAVKTDIIKATDYYKKINSELAKQFLFRIHEAKDFIASTLLGFQIKYKQVRTLFLKQFHNRRTIL
jgi:hypothetical protein